MERQLVSNIEQRTKSGKQPFRTLCEHLGRAPLSRDKFTVLISRYLPGAELSELNILFDRYADGNALLLPEMFSRRVFGLEVRELLEPSIRMQGKEIVKVEDESNRSYANGGQALMVGSPPVPDAEGPNGLPVKEAENDQAALDGMRARCGSICPQVVSEAEVEAEWLALALEQVNEAIDAKVAEMGRREGVRFGGLPPSERVTLHASRARVAAQQLAALRMLRSVLPQGTRISASLLRMALESLRPYVEASLQVLRLEAWSACIPF